MSHKASSLPWLAGAVIGVIGLALVALALTMASNHAGATVNAPAHQAAPAAVPRLPAPTVPTSAPTVPPSTVALPPPAPTTAATHHPATTTTTPTTRPVSTTLAPATGPLPAAPGTYRYHQVGSLPGTPSVGTLVVAPVSASGTQTWTRVVGGTVAPSTTVMLFNTTGVYLVDPGASAAGASATCTFSTPVAWPPWPTTVGAGATGQATCSAPVSSYQVTVRVVGSAMLPLDGATVEVAEVLSTIVIGGNYDGSPLNVTMTETDYYAPTLRVPVETVTHVSGHVLGLSVTTSRTDTLLSATP